MERVSTGVLEWAVVERPLQPESVSGDAWVLQEFGDGVLIGCVDGVGHGPEAHEAARTATAVLRRFAHESPAMLLTRCESELRHSRGAAVSLASIDARRDMLTWAGIGNVAGVLVRERNGVPVVVARLIAGPGIVGRRALAPAAGTWVLHPGDTLIFATDGIRGELAGGVRLVEPLRRIADRILELGATDADDVLVLVARYRGRTP
jgi:hypothetical protein